MAGETTPPSLSARQHPGCIAIGWSGIICKTSDNYIIKHPKSFPENSAYNTQFRDLIDIEKNIYERLGEHKGIIKYLGVEDDNTGAIRLSYARHGDLKTYIQDQDPPTEELRSRWIRLLVETFHYIYLCKVLHQDIKLNNILVDEGCLKVIDFANAGVFALDADMEAICADDPLSRVDLLCLGCVMYSIATWQIFFYDYFLEDKWPTPTDLPSSSGILYGEIIQKCWGDKYDTIAMLQEDVSAWSAHSQVATEPK